MAAGTEATIMGMLLTMNESASGTSGCIQQPSRQVLASLPLLVYEYKDAGDATDEQLEPTPVVDHPDSTATAATATKKMLIYSLSERSIVYTTHGRPRPQPQIMMDGNNFCLSTPQGWVLILGQASDAWLWHPLTGETITLPPIQDDHYIPVNCNCLLTHNSAAHPDCAVVLLDVADPLMWFCRVNGGTDRRWGQHTYDIGDCDIPEEFRTSSTPTKNVIPNVAALRGKLHFFFIESNQHKMCIVDLDFPPDHASPPAAEFHEFDVNNLEFPDDLCSGTICLVESMDELFAVCICYVDFDPTNIGAVVIYKMEFCGEKPVAWHRVHGIGEDRAFLLTEMNMATWCSASAHNNLQGNTICFLKKSLVSGDNRDLCIYDIQKQTMEIVQVHNEDLKIVRMPPYWINVPPC